MKLKDEAKVVLFLALGISVLELASRIFETHFSADVRQMLSQVEVPERIEKARREGRESVLILGNSLARAGILESGIRERFVELRRPAPEILYMTPDGSDVSDWTAAYRKCFRNRNQIRAPDYLLIGTGQTHLEDRPVVSPEKLAAYHAGREDFGIILGTWLGSTGERCRFLSSAVSRLFANRERLRPILFYNFVPGYEEVARRLNEREKIGALPPADRDASAGRFGLLLDSIDLPSERVMVAAVPLPWSYRLNTAVLETAKSEGVRVFAEEVGNEWPTEAFPDGYHLAPEFGATFTKALMAKLIPER